MLAASLGEPKQRGRVVLWDVASHMQIWSHLQANGIPAVAFSPDGKTLAIGGYDRTAKLLETATGKPLRIFKGHANLVRAVAFSPDGKTLATGSWDRTVRLWDVADGSARASLDWPEERLYALAYSPDGGWLLAAGDIVRVWNAALNKEKHTIKPYFSPWAVFATNDWFLTGSYDGTIRLWSVASGEQRLKFHGFAGVERLAVSAQARLLAETGGKTINLFDFTLAGSTPKEKERIRALLLRLDDDAYEVREAAGQEMLTLGFVAEPELARAMKESPSAEVRIRCRRLREELLSKPRATLTGHTEAVESLAFAPDGRLLASGSSDGTVRLWHVKDHKEAGKLVP